MNNFFVARYSYAGIWAGDIEGKMTFAKETVLSQDFIARFPSEAKFLEFINEQVIRFSEGELEADCVIPTAWITRIQQSGVLHSHPLDERRGSVLVVGRGTPDESLLESPGLTLHELAS